MSAAMYREFVLSGPSVAATLVNFLKSNAGAFVERGTPLRVIVTEEEMDRLDIQIAYYFGPLVKRIAENAWVDGKQFSKDVWHVHFAKKFLPAKELLLPDGEIEIKRGSIARGQISLKKMTTFITQVEAYAAAELGVEFE